MSFDPSLFVGKVAVVTGGTSGIGAAVARTFAALGATVHAVGLAADRLAVPAGLDLRPRELDVTQEADVQGFFGELGQLDILVNGAGISLAGREHEWDGFRKVLDINLGAVMRISTLARPLLAKRGAASIINVASMYSSFGSAERPAYAASKGAVVQLTKSLAQAYAADGIRVNAVAPGWIDTPLLAPLKADAQIASAILGRTPLGRFGAPDEIGQAMAFLASPAAGFITGVVLPVDGGYLTV